MVVGRDSQWQYDLYYARSQTNVNDKQGWPLAGPLDAFFTSQIFGPQLGTTGPYPIYGTPNLTNLYKPGDTGAILKLGRLRDNAISKRGRRT